MKCLIVVFSVFLLTGRVMAHGTEGWIEDAKGVQLVARYDDGEPMGFAKVTVTIPDHEGAVTTVFQRGSTDRNGIFMFKPDVGGRYRVTVQDAMGHQLVLGKTVKQNENQADIKVSPSVTGALSRTTDKPTGIVSGVAAIFGLGGMVYGWRQKQLCRKEQGGRV